MMNLSDLCFVSLRRKKKKERESLPIVGTEAIVASNAATRIILRRIFEDISDIYMFHRVWLKCRPENVFSTLDLKSVALKKITGWHCSFCEYLCVSYIAIIARSYFT